MKLGCITAGCLHRGMVIELVWSDPFKSVKHMGYENTTKDTETSTWQLHKKCHISAKGKSLKFKPVVLQDGRFCRHYMSRANGCQALLGTVKLLFPQGVR